MGIRGKTPSNGDGIGSWMHDKVPAGAKRSGWIAGDVHVVHCHCSRSSKPCLTLLIGANAECVGCGEGKPAKPLGFVPLYRWDGRPVFIIIREHQFEMVGRMKLHTWVEWSREDGRGEGIAVKEQPLQRPWTTTIAAKSRPVDLCGPLATIFGMPEIAGVLRESMGPIDNAVSPAAVVPPKEVGAQVQTEHQRHTAEMRRIIRSSMVVKESEPALLGDVIPEPSVNGSHKRK